MKKIYYSLILWLCIFNIAQGQTPNFSLTAAIAVNGTTTSPTITQGANYTASVTVTNNSSTAGTYDLECDFFTSGGTYLIVVQKQCSQYFTAGQTRTIAFSSNSPMTYAPGTYGVGVKIFYSSCNSCGTTACSFSQPTNGYANPRVVTVISSCTATTPTSCSTSIGSPANGLVHHTNLSCSSVANVDGYSWDYSFDGSNWTVNWYSGTAYNLDVPNGDSPNSALYYRVRTYCGTTYSSYRNASSFPIYTACDEPATPTVNSPSSNSLNVTLNSESPVSNPSTTTYAIYCSTYGQYVQSNGTLGSGAYYLTKSSWEQKPLQGYLLAHLTVFMRWQKMP